MLLELAFFLAWLLGIGLIITLSRLAEAANEHAASINNLYARVEELENSLREAKNRYVGLQAAYTRTILKGVDNETKN